MTGEKSDAARSNVVVCCDFDGTISIEDLGVATMDRFAPREWWDIELAWRRGEISSKECLARQFALLRTPLRELEEFWASQPIDPWFHEFVDELQKANIPLIVLSDGGDYYIDVFLKAHGLTHLELRANRMEYVRGVWRFSFPHESSDCDLCGNCKRDHVAELKKQYATVVFIGDGHSDKCVIRHADRVWAKGFLAEYCAEQNVDCVAFSDFRELIPLIPTLRRNSTDRRSPSRCAPSLRHPNDAARKASA